MPSKKCYFTFENAWFMFGHFKNIFVTKKILDATTLIKVVSPPPNIHTYGRLQCAHFTHFYPVIEVLMQHCLFLLVRNWILFIYNQLAQSQL